MRKVILYIATSLDGYIAAPGDDLSFLDIVQKEGEDYGYGEFIGGVDTIIIGRKTYEWVIQHVPEYAHPEKEVFVITRTARPSTDNLQFYTGDLAKLVTDLKGKDGKNIFIDGGAEVVHTLLANKLIDEFVISVIPVLLGDGVRLFKDGRPEQKLELVSSKQFEKGLLQLCYKSCRD